MINTRAHHLQIDADETHTKFAFHIYELFTLDQLFRASLSCQALTTQNSRIYLSRQLHKIKHLDRVLLNIQLIFIRKRRNPTDFLEIQILFN